ncbi:MAG TPA: hypothetical protein VLG49_06505 [Rhabdochlamydiaceae bacterium]|nr:hypothetical protein [Rhabdochlamydiaceae bacterium]
MEIGFFRNLRRKRVIRLEEDLDFGIKKTMRDRWDFLTLIEFYQNLDELEGLIRKDKIIEEHSIDQFLHDIEKIKKDYPFDKKLTVPNWDFNHFLLEILWLSGNIKKVILLPSDSLSQLPSYSPMTRAWKILDGFYTLAQKRRDNVEEEEKRITTFILIAVKKHIYYMQFLIDILLIVVGIVIGWLFSK